jgi:hypothetical protein
MIGSGGQRITKLARLSKTFRGHRWNTAGIDDLDDLVPPMIDPIAAGTRHITPSCAVFSLSLCSCACCVKLMPRAAEVLSGHVGSMGTWLSHRTRFEESSSSVRE